MDGSLQAQGVWPGVNLGASAGGSIWLDAGTLSGNGLIQANGASSTWWSGGGGGGRVAIYYTNASAFNLNSNALARGGVGHTYPSGGAGTLYLVDKASGVKRLLADNTGVSGTNENTEICLEDADVLLEGRNVALAITGATTVASLTMTNVIATQNAVLTISALTIGPGIIWQQNAPLLCENFLVTTGGEWTQNEPMTLSTMVVQSGAVWIQNAELTLPSHAMTVSGWTWVANYSQTWASVTVTNGGTITHSIGNTNGLILTVDGPVHVATNSTIDVSGRGFTVPSLYQTVGGSYGGQGGSDGTNQSVETYGSLAQPSDFGGGSRNYRGGGKIKIVAEFLAVDGCVTANGDASAGSSQGVPAGGSIWIDTVCLQGGGIISASAISGISSACGGGGGRIAIHYSDVAGFDLTGCVSAAGSPGRYSYASGSNGTVYLRQRQSPVIHPVTSPTAIPEQLLSGTRESWTAVWLHGTQVVAAAESTNWSHTVALAEGTNTFSFVLVDEFGRSGPTSEVAIVFVVPPGPVAATSAVAITIAGFQANWTATPGATNYLLDVATDSSFENYLPGYQGLSVGDVTSVEVTGLSAGETYYYRLWAQNFAGTSESSEIIVVGIPAAQPAPILRMDVSSANATVLWASTGGVIYEVYQSDDPFGAGMGWVRVGVVTAETEQATTVVGTGSSRFYQVVVSGCSPQTNQCWLTLQPVVKPGYTLMSPGVRSDRMFDDRMGADLAAALEGSSSGDKDKVFILETNGAWRTLWLDENKVWREEEGAPSAFELPPGSGFFVEHKGSPVQPTFTGPVGNDGTQSNKLVAGWNLIGLSEGKELPLKAVLATANPVGGATEETADLVVLQNADGSWRRLMYVQGWGESYDGNWFDLSRFQIYTNHLKPGAAYYYYRQARGGDTTVEF